MIRMDLSVYVSSVESRVFLALAGLLGALAIDAVRGILFRNLADPRPLLERLADIAITPVILRMNRAGRAQGTLLMRGLLVLAIGCAMSFALVGWGFYMARLQGQGGAYLTLLLAFSVGTVGWFPPLKALARLADDPRAPRPFVVLARAAYSNLVTLDDSGLIRVAATAAVRSILIRLVAPVAMFVFFGWQGLALYWPIMIVALAAGQDGTNHAFAAPANALATVLLLLPSVLAFPLILLALFFSAGASFFRALPGLVKVTRWPSLLQGGLSLMLVAYAMKLMLGGPRQDRTGAPVPAPWVGPEGGTARLEPRDIGRVLYLQVVVLLLTASTLYVLSVLL